MIYMFYFVSMSMLSGRRRTPKDRIFLDSFLSQTVPYLFVLKSWCDSSFLGNGSIVSHPAKLKQLERLGLQLMESNTSIKGDKNHN